MSIRFSLLTSVLLLAANDAFAQSAAVLRTEWVAPAASESFGESLALDGDTLVVGANNATGGSPFSGAVYAYVRAGAAWIQQARLTASDGQFADGLGMSVAVRGDRIAVGAPHRRLGGIAVGAVYLYSRTGSVWSQEAILTAPNPGEFDRFGHAVSVSGDNVYVSAPGASTAIPRSGAVFVFERQGGAWPIVQTILPDDAATNHVFGEALSVDGSRLAVGAIGDVSPTSPAGSAYVFAWDGSAWRQEFKFNSPPLSLRFGAPLVLQGDRVLIGCPECSTAGLYAGAAFLYRHGPTGWTPEATFVECQTRTNFGSGVAIDGDRLLVAANDDPEAGPYIGTIHVLELGPSGWQLQAKVVPPQALENVSYVGLSVLLSGDRVYMGSPGSFVGGTAASGRTFEHQLVPTSYPVFCEATVLNGRCDPCPPWSLQFAGSGCENAARNCGTQLVATGQASLANEDLVMRARGLPRSTSAALFQAGSLGSTTPFGAGRLCTSGTLLRIATQGARDGGWTYPLPGDPAISVRGSVPPGGGVRHYQLAYRDTIGFCGGQRSNVTAGISVTWVP